MHATAFYANEHTQRRARPLRRLALTIRTNAVVRVLQKVRDYAEKLVVRTLGHVHFLHVKRSKTIRGMLAEFLEVATVDEVRRVVLALCDSGLYEQAREGLDKIVSAEGELSIEDQNAVSRTCKGIMDSYRKSWKSVSFSEQKERGKGRDDRSTPLRAHRKSSRAVPLVAPPLCERLV